MDFVADGLADGCKLPCPVIVDDCTRECLAIEIDTFLTGRRVFEVLERLRPGKQVENANVERFNRTLWEGCSISMCSPSIRQILGFFTCPLDAEAYGRY